MRPTDLLRFGAVYVSSYLASLPHEGISKIDWMDVAAAHVGRRAVESVMVGGCS